ncbi:Clp protease N-terminal domain-containing protein [Streptomyces canus]|uniref:Clp protease N-terminal domain-containing protein n=1 Tax=Streptomyces canus TaxID=58343 RepID=UPI0032472F23
MRQQEMSGAHADDGTALIGAATEFEPDVMDLLVETMRRAVRSKLSTVGTDTLLGAIVLGDTDPGEAIAPGMRKAGSLSGLIAGRAGLGWVSDDEVRGVPVAAGVDEGAHQEADENEVDAAWREARWRYGLGVRGSAPDSGRVPPGMTGAMHACLLLALRSARAEGTISVRCRHVARALLELPDSRAREAMELQRLDLSAAANTLDASVSTWTEGPESRGVTLLRRAGTLGKSGNRLTRALTSWTSGSAVNGSPVLFAVSVEAARQAVRSGRAAVEPVDLLLGILALDRALFVAGRSLPGSLAKANSAPALMRRHGVRQSSLLSSASMVASASVVTSASVIPSAGVPDSGKVRPSTAADRVMAVARLSAAEHGSPTVGTVHLLSALLDESATDTDADADAMVVRLLAAHQVEVAALRAELGLRLDA